VFNPLVSLEDTMVGDRGLVKQQSLAAKGMRFVDRRAFRSADLVVADTAAHARYFVEQFGLPDERVAVCFAAAEDRLFRPGWRPSEDFHCLFYGKLIPLHGLETILEAARQAPEIRFRIAGTGQLEGVLEGGLPENVEWVGWVDHDRIPEELWSAGCALGIFGTTEKAQRVIPNKAFEAIACGAPLITADTPAARELLEDGRDALLVPPGDAGALARAVRRLAADSVLRGTIAAQGRATYEAHGSEEVLGRRWRALLEALVRNRRPASSAPST
jgi:glycosyltransferase involved in cell wall biosynthesis